MTFRSPLGISDFRQLREQNASFVDKSNFIIEFLESTQQVLLLPRPRRFGKTINLSMLRYFLERSSEDLSHLFEDLQVFRSPKAPLYKQEFQKHPIIFISFKNIKANDFQRCYAGIVELLLNLYREHESLLSTGKLSDAEAADYRAVLSGQASALRYELALADLCKYMHKAYGQRPFVLIDEYDNPIHGGWIAGYGADILEFFRAFLTAGLKDNAHLHRAVLTGILRIARESIFSGLNNLAVYTLIDPPFSTCFGFSEDDVRGLLDSAGHPEWMPSVQAWYNGYLFDNKTMYNPWSVLAFLSNNGLLQAYWINTSSNDLIKRILQKRAAKVGGVLAMLIQGGSLDTLLQPNTVLDDLDRDEGALWSLLTFSGYLKAERLPQSDPLRPALHRLSIPNAELRLIYAEVFEKWLQHGMEGHGANLNALLSALFEGDAEGLEEQLQALVLNVLSYHDPVGSEPESIYQAFVLGLLCVLEPDYRVRSNRESGRGRPDVMILPKQAGKAGVILELKAVRRERWNRLWRRPKSKF